MKTNLFLAFFLFGFALSLQAQQVGINTNTPDPSAVLDVFANDKGLLFPRLTTTQRNAIVNPANGLTVYNTTSHCLETYFPNGWAQVNCGCMSFPSALYTTSPANPAVGQALVFQPAVAGATYTWQFQSGTPSTSNVQNPSVTWNNAGTYQVIFSITDASGCTTVDTTSVVLSQCAPSGSQSFSYTGNSQTWTVPACVTSIQVDAYGAQGGSSSGGAGGLGGRVQATLTVSPGEVLQINVGGSAMPPAAGWNGGGAGLSTGGGGGGATDIRRTSYTLNDRILVAGGGGGGAQGAGGAGGGLTGAQGSTNGAGVWALGGSQSAGGAGGKYTNGGCSPGQAFASSGTFGIGGNGLSNSSCCCVGTGGGGGWYGGGGMQINGAGGGSSYVNPNGASNITHNQGVNSGNGSLTINW